jgi:hypothetical protein
MQTCVAAEGACRYCGSSEIILAPVEAAGKCARCSWPAHVARSPATRLRSVMSRVERERFLYQGVVGEIPLPPRRRHARIGDGRRLKKLAAG